MDPDPDLSIINPHPARLDGPSLLHELITSPCDSVALDHLQDDVTIQYTYNDLHQLANAVASRLSHVNGYRDGQLVVPVLIEQSPALHIALLGILKAGGAFCPLNIDAPPDRVSFIFRDVAAKAVIVSRELASKIPQGVVAEIIIAEDALNQAQPAIALRGPGPDDLAYVMYTSGSTGTPKGVGLPHGAVTQALLAHERHILRFTRFLQFAAPTFDVSVFETFFPLIRGATLIVVDRGEMLNDLPGVMNRMEVDACELTPTVAGSLLRQRSSVPKLKLLLTIGEMLTEPVIQEFGGSDEKPCILWAMYGPTEATIHCTLQPAMLANSSARNIGIPLDTVSCFIIQPLGDDHQGPFTVLRRGDIGELAVGGYQLATCYLNRPEQTAASFISTPYGRLYRTGDKARVLPDGTLECLGRLSDGQVKLRGQRLELGEVEQAVLRTPGCHGAMAAVHDNILVVFCTVDGLVPEDAILEQCQKWLPRFMIPGEIVLMEVFPQLPSGKVNRRQVMEGFKKRKLDGIDDGKVTKDEVPDDLMEVVRRTLNDNVNSSSTLSATGLDSLKAITLASDLREAGFPADAVTLLKAKTARDLWSQLQKASLADSNASAELNISLWSKRAKVFADNPTLRRNEDSVEDIIPCTPLQTAMLFETLHEADVYWNEVYFEASSNATDIKRALHQIVQNNEILRTAFVTWGKGFASVIFKKLGNDQITIVDKMNDGLLLDNEDALSKTLLVQIKPHPDGSSSLVYIRIHHAIYDGWSMDMIKADLSAIINGATPRPRAQFRNITQFHEIGISEESLSLSKAFWANHLAGWAKDPFPSLLDHAVSGSGSHTTKDIISTPSEDVESLANGLGCSVQTFFQASLAVAWGGILGSTDIVLGTVTSGRSIPVDGVERIMGPCIASLPLRINFERMTEIVHLLNHIHSANRGMLQHSAMPLSEIKKLVDLQPGDHLFDVLFVYQQSTEAIRGQKSVLQETMHLDRLETKLLIEVEPQGHGFAVQATYHQNAMYASMASTLIAQVKTLLEGLCQHPQATLSAWRQGMAVSAAVLNHPPTPAGGVMELASMFEATVAQDPDQQALCFTTPSRTGDLAHETLTYHDLNVMSNRIAHFLLSEGMGTRQVVAIIMHKSIQLYASILAIVKAGCAYLPILSSTPIERVRNILSQAKARHCVVDDTSSKAFKEIRDVRFISPESANLADFQSHNLDIPADPTRLAYVIYTSGTTGTPKGVAITQLNIASNIRTLVKIYPKALNRQSRLLQACSQAFDVSVFEIFYAWHAGMCLCAGTNDTILEDLEYAIRELQITHLSLTPTVASLIKPENVPSVEFLVTAGEPMTERVLEQWGDLLWQGYGPSETTNICSVKQMRRGMPIAHLGLVFPNTSVFVLSPGSTDALPRGWVGEFCFGGDQVAHGYLNMPQTTSERFINHPTFGRIYRSGDIGRMLPDGSLAILGRIDDQIKLRGLRIETGEISSIIASTGAASSAVAMLGRRRHASSDQLIAFYVSSDDTPGDGVLDIDDTVTRTLFSTLQSRLPSYMVPSYLIPLARIPLTSSGKLHRRRLQDWFRDLPSRYLEAAALHPSDASDSGTWSPTETLLAEVIEETTGTMKSEIKRWTPFAIFGIDSVSAIGLASCLSTRLGRRVPISSIIRHPNIAQLAGFFDSEGSISPARSASKFFSDDLIKSIQSEFGARSKDVESVLPCTPLQEAMLSGTERSYFNRTMLRLQISGDRMKQYWDEMARRHEILRTCFVTTSDANRPIAQVVLQKWDIPWRSFNVTQLSFDAVVDEHLSMLPAAIDSKVPPLSLGLIRYRGSLFLSFICHHALYDGVAMENLWREVEALANGMSLPPPASYRPFLEEALNLPGDVEPFWKDKLHDFSSSSLFASSSGRRVDQTSHTKSLKVPLSVLQARVRTLGVSLLSLCQGAWSNTLSIAYSSSDVCFGNVVSGRSANVEGVDKLIAPCFNTVPIRADLSTKTHGDDLVKYFHQLNADMLPYQFTPLRLVQKLLNQQGRGLFETLLLLQTPLHGMDDSVWILEEDNGDMDVPLVCEVVPCPNVNTVTVSMHYDMNVVDPTSAATLLDVFEYLLERILDAPYAAFPTRDGLPENLQDGLQGVRVRRQRQESLEQDFQASADWTSIESTIRNVIAQLSHQPERKISRQTTIYQLGLDSINAVQVAAMLRRAGLNASASDVIECPSCSKLAERLSASISTSVSNLPPQYDLRKFAQDVSSQIEPKVPSGLNVEAILPCTPMQCAIVTSFIQTGGQEYFNVLKYEVDGHVSRDTLIAAWRKLQQKHPMLRTAFVPVRHSHTAFAMLRYTPDTVALPITDCDDGDPTSLQPEEFERSLRETLVAQSGILPWHVRLTESQGTYSMSLFIQHALYDAQSLDSLLSSLLSVLQGASQLAFPAIEPALSEFMSKSIDENGEAKDFWTEKAQATVVNSFPVMTPLRESSEKIQSMTGDLSISFSELQDATQAAGVTVQAAIQAAWTRILSSYIGEQSVTFGVTFSGRTSEATKGAPFPCIVTLPVVSSSMSSNAELLRYMMDYNTHMHKAQFTPLTQIQKWLGHAASPIFDTLISYNRSGQTPTAGPLRLVADQAAVEYPVSLSIDTHGEKIQVSVSFKPTHLPHKQATIIHQQFDAVLSHLVFSPSGMEDELHMQVPELFSQLPPRTPVMDCSVKYLHEFVEEKAVSYPGSIALEFVDSLHTPAGISRRQWTFKEVDEIGNRVARLVSRQAPINSIVAIHFGKCPEAYFSILGILKAGCSFVALDTTAPASRKEFILGDSGAPCILTGPGTLDFELKPSVTKIVISDEVLKHVPATKPILGHQFTPDSTCYCLYTSGTTGTPKGCEITHENAVQAMMAFQELFRGHWDADARWLQFAALHFDVSVLEQYWTWSVGMTVVAAPKDLILDDLTGTINKLGITHIDLTPSLARLTHPKDVPSLCKGVFITGGESLNQEVLDAWGDQAVIYNAYGPTEATIGVTMFQRVPVNGRPSNIGRQFPNVGSYVFQPGTEIPVLQGGVGELCVSGKLVGKGYLGRDDLTAERFPHLKVFKERVYRTGDLVRVLHDGCFDFIGRADDQVKLRGQRLEIGEINHIIRSLPEISDAATIVTSHGTSQKSVLISFVVSRTGDRSRELEILQSVDGLDQKAKEACRSRLPGYMVPSYCFELPYIPLSVNNKAEVKELKRLFTQLSHEQLMELVNAQSASMAEVSDEKLKTIIRALATFSELNESGISPQTSIFDIGVDSITALRLSSLLKEEGLVRATPATILRHPIVQDLARILCKESTQPHNTFIKGPQQRIRACTHRFSSLACRVLGCASSDIEYIAPCSPLQQGIISKSLITEERGAYFNSFKLKLAPDIDPESLRSVWSDLIASESILRTAFLATSGGHVQVALWKERDIWQALEANNQEEAIIMLNNRRESWIHHNATHILKPLQLLYISTPHGCSLHINIFHAIYDGNSFDLILSRIASHLQGEYLSTGPSFLDALVHGPLSTPDSRSFWKEQLSEWKPSTMSSLSPSLTDSRAVVSRRQLSFGKIDAVRSAQNVTLQAVVLALWTSVLQQHHPSGLTIGTVVSGRSIDLLNVDKTIGPLFNTLPFFNKSINDRTWSSLIKQSHDFGTSALPFQHVSLQKIQKWFSNGRPLFDTLFTFQLDNTDDSSNGLWETVEGDPEPDYPLAVEFKRSGDGKMSITLVAQGHITDQASLDEMLDVTETYLDLMATQTDNRIPAPGRLGSEVSSPSGSVVFTTSGDDGFLWDDVATAIREEVAALVAVYPSDVGATTAMLELGLDSIDMIKLSTKLRGRKIDIPASQIMRLQTIAKLSRVVHGSGTDGDDDGAAAEKDLDAMKSKLREHLHQRGIDLSHVEDVLPTTALQDSMLAAMAESEFEWYFNHDVLELADRVDLKKIKAAWKSVTRALPILRTGFLEVEDSSLSMGFCQLIAHSHDPWREDIVAQELSDADGIVERAKERAKKAHLSRELFQLSSLTIGTKVYLVLSIAHALYDGWSLGLIYRELQNAYQGGSVGSSSTEARDKALSAASSQETEGFWTVYLSGAMPSLIPRRHIDVPAPTVHRAEKVSSLSTGKVQSFCKSSSISLQALFQGCWAIVLANWTKQLDVTFGVVMSGRDFPGAEDLVFPTMNTVAARYMPFGTSSEFLQYVEENLSGAREHQCYPLRKALAAAGSPPGGLFNSLFLLQRSVGHGNSASLLKSIRGQSAVDYPVCLEAEVMEAGLVWRTACQSQYVSDHGAHQLVAQIDDVLQYLISSPESQILAFSDTQVSICGQTAITLRFDEGEVEIAHQPKDQAEDWTETSIAIRHALSQVSQIPEDDIRLSNTIYHLGLDSISVLKVSSRLRRQGLDLTPRQLLVASNIEQMAEMAHTEQSNPGVQAEESWKLPTDIDVDRLLSQYNLSTHDVEAILPALPMQVYMLSTWQNSGGEVFYPEFSYLYEHDCDIETLHAAWETLVGSTPILRTCLVVTSNAELPVLQVIVENSSVGSFCPMANFQATWDDSKSVWVLKLRIHHALYDGVSLPVIMDRLAQTITATEVHGQRNSLPSSWFNHTTMWASEEATASRKAFWTKYLSGCALTSVSKSSRLSQTERVSLVEHSAMTSSVGLRNRAATNGVSVQSLFLAAYAKILHKRESASNISTTTASQFAVFGIYLANRGGDTYDEQSMATFPCLNLVPLKVDVSQERLEVIAAQIQHDLGEINSHGRADVGLWEIDAWTGIKLSSFVNFLSLPDVFSTDDADKPKMKAVDGVAQAAKTPNTAQMDDVVVRDSFLPALDVEASLQGDGLDIGVFGARSLLADESAAADLIAEIVAVLQDDV